MKLLLLFLLFSTQAFALSAADPRQHSPNAPVTISVTNSSAQGIVANLNRTGLVCTNVGSDNVSIAWGGNAAVSNKGITLTPGLSFSFDDYMMTTAAMNVISPTSTTMSCQEYN